MIVLCHLISIQIIMLQLFLKYLNASYRSIDLTKNITWILMFISWPVAKSCDNVASRRWVFACRRWSFQFAIEYWYALRNSGLLRDSLIRIAWFKLWRKRLTLLGPTAIPVYLEADAMIYIPHIDWQDQHEYQAYWGWIQMHVLDTRWNPRKHHMPHRQKSRIDIRSNQKGGTRKSYLVELENPNQGSRRDRSRVQNHCKNAKG
jgi:hypothetical protein